MNDFDWAQQDCESEIWGWFDKDDLFIYQNGGLEMKVVLDSWGD